MSFSALLVLLHALAELLFLDGWPNQDGGVFATVAWGILRGGVPYRDYWDHKPPGVYYLDALFFKLFGASPQSLHIGETLIVLMSLPAFYWLARNYASPVWAAVGTLVFATYGTLPSLTVGGNLTEIYWELPAVLTFGAILRYIRSGEDGTGAGTDLGLLMLAGVAVYVSSMFRPHSLLYLPIVAVVVLGLGFRSRCGAHARQVVTRAALPLVTVGALLALTGAYFAANDALTALWDAVVRYNRVYVTTGSETTSALSFVGWAIQTFPLVALFSAAALLAGGSFMAHAVRTRARRPGQSRAALTGGVLIAWALIDFLGTLANGRLFGHYLLLLVPSLSALLTYGLSGWWERWVRANASQARRHALNGALLILVAAAVAVPPCVLGVAEGASDIRALTLEPARNWREIAALPPRAGTILPLLSLGPLKLSFRSGTSAALARVIAPTPAADVGVPAEIIARTNPNDYILIYGNEARLYFLAGRNPASRWIYLNPLVDRFGGVFAPGAYSTREMQEKFLLELQDHVPQLILVQTSLPQLPDFAHLLETQYARVGSAGTFSLYARRPSVAVIAPRTVQPGAGFQISVVDPTSADADAGSKLTYTFQCGLSPSIQTTSSSVVCAAPGSGRVRIRVRVTNKAGGYTTYSAGIRVGS